MSNAKIHDLGYQKFAGHRLGISWSMKGLAIHTVQRILGLKRSARHKFFPATVIFIAFIPALVYVGMAAILQESLLEENILPTYAEYYGFILIAILIFVSFAAPQATCTDRGTGMMALYLASPLNRTTYILSKLLAVAIVLLTITWLPEIMLLIAYSIEGAGPEGITGFFETLARITGAGALAAAYFAAVSSAVVCFTPRTGVASTAIVIILLVPTIVLSILLETTNVADEFDLLNVTEVPFRAVDWILEGAPSDDRGISRVSGPLTVAITIAATSLFTAISWWRYQRMEVDR